VSPGSKGIPHTLPGTDFYEIHKTPDCDALSNGADRNPDQPSRHGSGHPWSGKPAAGQTAGQTDLSRYVGSDSCAECHEAETTFYALTPHNRLDEKNPVHLQRCEACHGGARDHVSYYKEIDRLLKEGKEAEATALMGNETRSTAATMRALDQLNPIESTKVCLQCHEGTQGRSDERFNYRRSQHFRQGISCSACHSSHSPKRLEYLLREKEPDSCYQCHTEQKTSFSKPFHHKVPEGGMKCSDCHNHHGGFAPRNMRNAVTGDMQCIKCHADKQGPFTFEHAPIKVEGCQACHSPHGSTNPKLLTRNVVKMLCLECHSNTPGLQVEGTGLGVTTPSFHDINNPRIANCTTCHSDIHGSNRDRFFR